MSDQFEGFSKGLNSPADEHFEITPNDNSDLSVMPRAIRFNGAGDVVLRSKSGTDVTYTVAAGEVLTFRPVRVLATGTTATGIVGWY